MKKIKNFAVKSSAFLFLAFVSVFQIQAQTKVADNGRMSASSSMLYNILKTNPDMIVRTDSITCDRFGIKSDNNRMYTGAFIQMKVNVDYRELQTEFDLKVNTVTSSVITARIPLDRFADLINSDKIVYIDVDQKMYLNLDNAKDSANVNKVHYGTGLNNSYTGKDVVVGIVDIGFEYNHPNFWDTLYQTFRIKKVWDQNAETGTKPQGFDYGAEYSTQNQIISAVYSHEQQSHGSHVAGIAAGSGTKDTSVSKYRGVAPSADLVFVSANAYTSGFYDAISYIHSYAKSVNKPCVINFSWGSHSGPHDGTSSFDRACDEYIKLNNKGLLLVGSAGNEGREDNTIHVKKTFSASDTVVRMFVTPDELGYNVTNVIDIWGDTASGQNLAVKVYVFNQSTNKYEDSSAYITALSATTTNYSLFDSDNEETFIQLYTESSNMFNNKPHIQVYSATEQSNSNQKLLVEIYAKKGTVHAWTNKGIFASDGYTGVTSGDNLYTVGELGGTGASMITVGAYTTRNDWTSKNGGYWYLNNATKGAKADFSSIGPLSDETVKPDVSAPGQILVSSVNKYNTNMFYDQSPYSKAGITLNGNNYEFGLMQGTSMSAPFVTGVMALCLEAYPNLSVKQAKWLLKQTSTQDNLTGSISSAGSTVWGAGKINAYGLVKLIEQKTSPVQLECENTSVCLGEQAIIKAPEGYTSYLWSDGSTTQTIATGQAGNYSVLCTDSMGFTAGSDTVTINIITTNYKQYFQSICEGDSVIFGDEMYNTSGVYTYTKQTASGCDSVLELNLTVNPVYEMYDTVIMYGQSVEYGGQQYTAAGNYTIHNTSMEGCDSTTFLSVQTDNSIAESNAAEFSIDLYPSPAKDFITLKLNGNLPQQITVQISDNNGRTVLNKDLPAQKETLLDIRQLAAGTYMITVNCNGKTSAKKFIVR